MRKMYTPPELALATDLSRRRDLIRRLIAEKDDLGADYRAQLEKAAGYLILAEGRLAEASRVRVHLRRAGR